MYTVPGTMIVLEEARVVGTLMVICTVLDTDVTWTVLGAVMEDNSRKLTGGVIVASVHVVLLLLLVVLLALLLKVVENTWLDIIVDSEIIDDELDDMSERDEKVNDELVEL